MPAARGSWENQCSLVPSQSLCCGSPGGTSLLSPSPAFQWWQWGRCPQVGGGGPLAEVRGSRLEGRILPFLSHPRLLPSSTPCVVSVLLPGLPYSLELSTQEGQPSPSCGAAHDEGAPPSTAGRDS